MSRIRPNLTELARDEQRATFVARFGSRSSAKVGDRVEAEISRGRCTCSTPRRGSPPVMSEAVDMHPERTLIPARTGWSKRLAGGRALCRRRLGGWPGRRPLGLQRRGSRGVPERAAHAGAHGPDLSGDRLDLRDERAAADPRVRGGHLARSPRLPGRGVRPGSVPPPRAADGHASCEENLLSELPKHWIEIGHAPQPINVFANFRVTPDALFMQRASRPGDAATFQMLREGVVVLLRRSSGHRRLPAWRSHGHGGRSARRGSTLIGREVRALDNLCWRLVSSRC